MYKALSAIRSIIGRIWALVILIRWPLVFKRSGNFLPRRENRRLVWGDPLIFTLVIRPPWKSDWRMPLEYHRFEITDFILIGLSIWMLLAVIFTPSIQQDVVGMITSLEVVRNLAMLMILVSLFDRDGGKIQTGILVVLGLVYNWSLFQLDGYLGSSPYALGAFFILLLQFVALPLVHWWQDRASVERIMPDLDPEDDDNN